MIVNLEKDGVSSLDKKTSNLEINELFELLKLKYSIEEIEIIFIDLISKPRKYGDYNEN